MKFCLKLRATLILSLCLLPFSTLGLPESDQVYDSFPHPLISAPLALDDHNDEYVEDVTIQRTREEEAAMIAKESGLRARRLCEETDDEYPHQTKSRSTLMLRMIKIWKMLWPTRGTLNRK
jgi:hypothetical protein